MKTFENLKFNSSLSTNEAIRNLYLKTNNLIKSFSNNNFNIYKNKEKLNKITKSFKELNQLKELQNLVIKDNFLKANNYFSEFSDDKQEENKKEEKIKMINLDSLSEVKNFKTELCHSWELTGSCKYGLNVRDYIINYCLQCVFAHGINDLRNPLKKDNKLYYKYKLCKQFFRDGYCPYGARCQFSHRKKQLSYIKLLEQVKKGKKITKKYLKVPRLTVFKNISINKNQMK